MSEKKDKSVIAYKGFNKDMTCRHFQYEEGKTYQTHEPPLLCHSGFHACIEPVDVFRHYHPDMSIYHQVALSGEMDTGPDTVFGDSKVCASEIMIGEELTPYHLIDLQKAKMKEDGRTRTDAYTKNCFKPAFSEKVALSDVSRSLAATNGGVAVARSEESFATASRKVGLAITEKNTSIASGIMGDSITFGIDSIAATAYGVASTQSPSSVAAAIYGLATASSYHSVAAAVEGYAEATKSGSVALVINGWAKGVKGAHLIFVTSDSEVSNVHLVYVDGERIKADRYYGWHEKCNAPYDKVSERIVEDYYEHRPEN